MDTNTYEIMKFTGKPVIIGGRLALKEINPEGSEPKITDDFYKLKSQPITEIWYKESEAAAACFNDDYNAWKAKEDNLRTLFVSLLAYDKIEDKYILPNPKNVIQFVATEICVDFDKVYTADIDENQELINLEII